MTATVYEPYKLDAVLPAKAFLNRNGGLLNAAPGMVRPEYRALGMLLGIAGGDRGYHASGDIITQTVDEVDLNALWDDYQASLAQWNTDRSALVSFLTFNITAVSEQVFQGGDTADFEEATEYGEPVGARPRLAGEIMGYPFKWFDLAGRFTWQFLADAPASQVNSFNNLALEADNRLVFLEVMRTLFRNTRRTNKEGNTVYPFYSGVAGDDPPDYKMTTFADSHNHFVTTGTATMDATNGPPDVEALMNLLAEHGYTSSNGYDMVIMVNRAQGDVIRQFRSVANGGSGLYDFVPAAGTPSFLIPAETRTVGAAPANTLRGMTVIGAYGDATIVQEDYIPAGYLVAFVTGGTDALPNPIAFRQHPTTSLQGLRLVKGRTPDYPLIDSFYARGFGTGVRHRGAGAVMQVTTGSYSVPTQYA